MDNILNAPFVENEDLSAYAASAARLLLPRGECGGARFLPVLRRWGREIRRCRELLRRRSQAEEKIPAAWEWLLDNAWMARREQLAAAGDFSRAGHLRRCGEGLLIVSLARSLVLAGKGQVNEERCRLFLDGFQSVTPLRRSELQLFPAALRAAVLEEMAAVCADLRKSARPERFTAPLEALFTTLRLFSVLDTEPLLTGADLTHAILCADPSGDYPRMDAAPRQDYLRRVAERARKEGLEEQVCARRLVRAAKSEGRHLGFFLFQEPGQARARLYIAANVLATLLLTLLIAFSLGGGAAALLLLLPVSQLVKGALDLLLSRLCPPRRLPRMGTEKGVPPEGKTVCVISVLLTDPDGARAQCRRLEELRMASRSEGENLLFGLLADLPEAEMETVPGDKAVLDAARAGIEALNTRYGGGFFLFTRARSFNGERWAGFERKRGALLELARLCCGEKSALNVTGDQARLAGTRYLLTLDSDTRIYPGAAGELIGAMLHPLNRPRLDERTGVVIGGHGVLQPRMDTELQSATATDFALIFAGVGGSDPYGGLCGELYMDAFGSGGFAGKGILDARALLRCTGERVKPGRTLSHDAVEGALLRGGFLGDAAFADAFPARPLSYFKRLHRWVRGDWQNLPFLFCRDLPEIERWRLFDSLRRSLLPPMTLFAILAGFLLPGEPLAVSAWAALLALLDRLTLSLIEGSLQQREKLRLRRFSRVLTGVGGAIVQTFLRLWLLPYEAWICLTAALTALWRMTVTHRKLLQWQTAAQAEQGKGGLWAHVMAFWPTALPGLYLLLFSPSILGRSAGLLWLLSPITAFALALPARREAQLSAADRDYLREAAGKSYQYYRDFCGAEDHGLPPDNYQEQPPVGLAHRSSPTNMGLAMASAAAARALELISRKEALDRIEAITAALERMPRWRGHFYNWYDTRSLSPLLPAFVSTVDSGNLCAALLTVRGALTEWGEGELAARLDRLIGEMDFSLLYDKSRGLFYISYDTEKERGVGGWYDLMASEAMLTSYLALARGQAPKKHWQRLSRAQLQKDGYRGLASWTGTMFEYLMPALFLPYCPGSLLQESARFCVYVQKRRRFPGKPWGISESAYYALDPALTYRYKANGCGDLALKRGQDTDLVTAPYAAFLALAIDPQGAVNDLRLFERCGALGRHGFYDALDFTPERCREEDGACVRCTMAHHVGMSVLAAANALCDGVVRRWFLLDPAMAAFQPLLRERLPDAGTVLRRDLTRAPEKPSRMQDLRWSIQGGAEDWDERRCLLTNGSYELLLSSTGNSHAACRGRTVYGSPTLEGDGPRLELLWGGVRRPLLSEAERWELSENRGLWTRERDGLLCSAEISAAAAEPGEARRLRLQALRSGAGQLSFSLRPILARWADYAAHPAYWELGIETEKGKNALLMHRLPRGEQGPVWLCLASDAPARVEDAPLCALTVPLELQAGETRELCFALCLGRSREAALTGARQILDSRDRADLTGAFAQRLGMSGQEVGAAMGLLPLLHRPLYAAAPRRDLWPYAISGDLPLLVCDGQAAEALPLLRRFLLLKSCGQEAELVYLSDEAGEYRQPLRRQISQLLESWGLEALLGARGGVHFVPRAAEELLRSRASVSIGDPLWRFSPAERPRLSEPRTPGAVPPHRWEDGSFCFGPGPLPGRVWQHVLSNGRLGAIVSDCGLSALWLENARELRLVPPMTDLRGTGGHELLWVELDGKAVSLFAANDGYPCSVCFAPGYARWEKRLPGRTLVTEALIPPWQDTRLLILRGAEGLTVQWLLEPVLGPGDASSLTCRYADGLFRAENPESGRDGLSFLAGSGSPCTCRTDFTPPAMLMRLEGEELTVLGCGCCSEAELRQLLRPGAALSAGADARAQWQRLLGDLRIETGIGPLDRYLNHWAAYQTLACRLMGRGSLYQSAGAYGFRDQLQDAVNLLLLDAGYARERILDACRHQYREGDVMHWWHPQPEGDKGVRTRCADDLLWLVWALCEYVEATGDLGLCVREEPFCASAPLAPHEHNRYETPEPAPAASVLAHARAALDCCLARGVGPHGLPRFGSGDWNDALDAVDGESAWMGWFLALCAGRFARLLGRLGQPGAERYQAAAEAAGRAAEASWNGRWYARGYWADGEPLGGEERIDLLPQAFAAMSPWSDPEHARAAVDAVLARLVDREHGILKLFDPPYGEGERSPGSIVGYGRGWRENGGQYTHGALWLIRACFRQGRREEALGLLRLLLPEEHDPERWEAEPFVLAADVSAAPGHEGEAGWTWYTGSAGWFFRIAAEDLLGLRLRDGALTVSPGPETWTAVWKGRTIHAENGAVSVDGEPYARPVEPN